MRAQTWVNIPPQALPRCPAFFRVLREWYADTPYDLTKGLAAGPFGSPNRYASAAGELQVKVSNGTYHQSAVLPSCADLNMYGINFYVSAL